MTEFDLLPVPNQRFSALLGGAWHEIELKALGSGAMAASIWREGEPVILGVRALPNRPLIPYPCREHGNFAFITDGGQYPSYERFGASCRFVWASPEELREARNG